MAWVWLAVVEVRSVEALFIDFKSLVAVAVLVPTKPEAGSNTRFSSTPSTSADLQCLRISVSNPMVSMRERRVFTNNTTHRGNIGIIPLKMEKKTLWQMEAPEVEAGVKETITSIDWAIQNANPDSTRTSKVRCAVVIDV